MRLNQDRSSKNPLIHLLAATMVLVLFGWSSMARGAENIVFHFDQTHGANPMASLIADAQGNLYGTTRNGGALAGPCLADGLKQGCGTVFELSPKAGGGWTEKVLYSFNQTQGSVPDGIYPSGTLVFDKQGNLYGTTLYGGAAEKGPDCESFLGCGTVFELTPGSGGEWTEKVISSFTPSDYYPNGDLTIDGAGNLYGTTATGGANGTGEVFELTLTLGNWTRSVIYSFRSSFSVCYTSGDGCAPQSGVILDHAGNLYGTTAYGGATGSGTVYELVKSGSQFNEKVLYSFMGGSDGANPQAEPVFDAAGNLYGTAAFHGANGGGAVYELSPASGGNWTESVLHSFASSPTDGSRPHGPLILDAAGNLYGTASNGGTGCNLGGCGVVFRLIKQTGGTWVENTLHQFESANDGSQPQAGLLFINSGGQLIGTTEFGGGRYGYGTVFEISK